MFRLFTRRNPPRSSPYDAVYQQLNSIDPLRFREIYSPIYTITPIDSYFPSIGLYTHALGMWHRCFINDLHLGKGSVPTEILALTLYGFFLKPDGTYQDSELAVREFIKAARKFITAYESLSHDVSDIGSQSYNRRVLTNVIANVCHLVGQLSKI